MNNLEIFKSEEFGEIRTVQLNNDPYFCMVDICKALEIGNISQAKTRLNADGVITNEVTDSIGRKQDANFINESNMYKLIFQSRKESAERFTDWVTSEVLPSIRKTGSYQTQRLQLSPDLQLLQGLVNQLVKQEAMIQSANDNSKKAIETVENMKSEYLEPLGDWRKEVNKKVREIAQVSEYPHSFKELFLEMYGVLESRAHCNLKTLKENKLKRLEAQGRTKTYISNETTYLAIIEDKPQLKEIFSNIVRQYAVRYLT